MENLLRSRWDKAADPRNRGEDATPGTLTPPEFLHTGRRWDVVCAIDCNQLQVGCPLVRVDALQFALLIVPSVPANSTRTAVPGARTI